MKINPSLQDLPLPLSTQTNFDKLFCYDIVAVSVNYYVLRSQKENNS